MKHLESAEDVILSPHIKKNG